MLKPDDFVTRVDIDLRSRSGAMPEGWDGEDFDRYGFPGTLATENPEDGFLGVLHESEGTSLNTERKPYLWTSNDVRSDPEAAQMDAVKEAMRRKKEDKQRT